MLHGLHEFLCHLYGSWAELTSFFFLHSLLSFSFLFPSFFFLSFSLPSSFTPFGSDHRLPSFSPPSSFTPFEPNLRLGSLLAAEKRLDGDQPQHTATRPPPPSTTQPRPRGSFSISATLSPPHHRPHVPNCPLPRLPFPRCRPSPTTPPPRRRPFCFQQSSSFLSLRPSPHGSTPADADLAAQHRDLTDTNLASSPTPTSHRDPPAGLAAPVGGGGLCEGINIMSRGK